MNEFNTSNNSRAFVINAVGDLSKVSFKCPLNEKPIIIEKKLEIITLSGYLSPTGSHLHVSISDESCSVFEGLFFLGQLF